MAGRKSQGEHDQAYVRGDIVYVCGQRRTVTLCWPTAQGYRIRLHQPVYGVAEWFSWEARTETPYSEVE